MKILSKTFEIKTKKWLEFIDITEKMESFVKESGVKNGILNIQSFHTTGAVFINENEPLLLEDMKEHLKNFVVKDKYYKHNDFEIRTVNMCDDECKNAHSHCLALHMPSSVSVNVLDGKIQLGQWQRIFFLELDHSRDRKAQALVMGE